MKKVFLYLLMLPLVAGIMQSCNNSKADAKNLDGRWAIVQVDGDNVVTEREAFMEFNIREKKLHGNAGCNVFNSSVTLDDNDHSAVKVDRAVSTMMACPDMETENRVLRALESVAYVKDGRNSNEVYLTNSAGKTLLVLSKR